MKGFLAVASREIRERRVMLLAAAVAGVIPFLVPLSHGVHGASASVIRQWTALILAASIGLGASLGFGFTTLAADIGSRRIGFYWTRPISGLAVWGGKIAGAWLLAMLGAILALGPSLLADGLRVPLSELPAFRPEWAPAALLGILLVSHAVGIAVRSRSPLLVVDVLALGLAYLSVRALSIPLLRILAVGGIASIHLIAAAALAIGVLVAGAAAITNGRTQIRRAHRTLSMTLWGIVGGGLVISVIYTMWILGAGPSSMKISYVTPGAAKSWVALTGTARATGAKFAFNVRDGRYARLPVAFDGVAFSRSGNRAAWFQVGREGARAIAWNLEGNDTRPAITRVVHRGLSSVIFLSDDGQRLAAYDFTQLVVYDLASGALVGSARMSGYLGAGQGLFVSPSRCRLFRVDFERGAGVIITEFDLDARRLEQTGVIHSPHPDPRFVVSPDGNHVILRDRSSGQVGLYEGRSGALETILDEHSSDSFSSCFLSGQRIAMTVAGGTRIRLLTDAGKVEQELAPGAPVSDILGEAAPGRLSLALRNRTAAGILDLASGRLEELGNLRPILPSWGQTSPASPGSDSSVLFFSTQGALVRVDPLSLQRHVVAGGRD